MPSDERTSPESRFLARAASFEAMWRELEPIGAAATGGYERFAWTPADLELRRWFLREGERRSMRTEQDRNGNLWAYWGGGDRCVATGSHLDSVPGGGAFDGPLGVVSAFLAVDELRARGATPTRTIAVACFADEEGARFSMPCVGSRLATGVLAPEAARELRDAGGVTLAEAMQDAGVDPGALGRDDERLAAIDAFVELHVEQGRSLAELDAPVGLATAIWPHGRWRLEFSGEANHAGTTRLSDRHDPMLPFATTVLAARQVADLLGAHATVGKAVAYPNASNAVAARVDAWLDGRAGAPAVLEELVSRVAAEAQRACEAHGVGLELHRESYSPEVGFESTLRRRIAAVLPEAPELPTGAGHDAGVLSVVLASAMLFVRNPTGVSHSPLEAAGTHDCLAGVVALADVLEELGCR